MMTRRTGRRAIGWALLGAALLAACAPASPPPEAAQLPTLMVLPSLTPTVTASATLTATITPSPTLTPSLTPTATPSPTLTLTPTVTNTPTDTPSPTFTPSPTPMGDARVSGKAGVNLRSGPSKTYTPALALLPTDTELILAGRSSDSQWFEVRTFDGLAGWVFGGLIEMRRPVDAIAVTWIMPPTPIPPPVVVAAPPPLGTVAAGGPPPPVTGISARVIQIAQTGRSLGNNPTAFSKVGDSLTANQPFMAGLANGRYDLGGYGYLQDTLAHFGGSWGRSSYAARSAFNAAAVLATIWADPAVCQPGETPLDCEYRINRPSVAVIMLGSMDMQVYGLDIYRTHMEIIVTSTISKGIVPVLTTFPNGPGFYQTEAEQFNAVIREIAAREQIPLIELRTPALKMPDGGCGPDQFHLSEPPEVFSAFTGNQDRYGLTLRELLTLQALDNIRRGAGL